MAEKKEGFGEQIIHFISLAIIIGMYQVFPEMIFWVFLIMFIGAYGLFIYSYHENITISYTVGITFSVIIIDIITYQYPFLINLPEEFSSKSEFYTTILLFSATAYFIVSLLFHSMVKSHWINLIVATFLIMIYKILSQFDAFMSIDKTFLSLFGFITGIIIVIGLFLYLGFLLGNLINKKINS
jgi:hypothetical protein